VGDRDGAGGREGRRSKKNKIRVKKLILDGLYFSTTLEWKEAFVLKKVWQTFAQRSLLIGRVSH
jgi:hypothetical protein